jgi:predicted deacetylase
VNVVVTAAPAAEGRTQVATGGRIAVALHDVEPRSFERCREIRAWLSRRGISKATLLVIPAADLRPIGSRAPGLACWLRGRTAAGDAIAQHGLAHRRSVRARWPRSVLADWQGGEAAEFPGLGAEDTRKRVACGKRLLNEIELDPLGFVAPGYAYTTSLRGVLAETFDWHADLRAIHGAQGSQLRAPALCLGTSTPLKRRFSPAIVRSCARGAGELMRLDIHPADFDLPGHVATLEALIARAAGREPVTYDQVLG